MNNSIINELKSHVIDLINDGHINADNLEDAHHVAFNEDYYIIGYYNADQWLERHQVSAWDAIAYVVEQELNLFGESDLKTIDINSETIVNKLVFFAGYDLDIEDLHNEIKGGK